MQNSLPSSKAPPNELGLLFRAWLLLIAGTVLQRVVPMTWWGQLMGTPGSVSNSVAATLTGSEEHDSRLSDLTNAIHRASRKLPWTPTCLAQAFAGQRILHSWNTPGEVFIGLKPEGDTDWPAHAWLTHQGDTLIGELKGESYFPATVYRMSGQTGRWPGTASPKR